MLSAIKPLILPMTTSNRQFYKFDAIPLSLQLQKMRMEKAKQLPEIFKQFKLPQ